MRKAVLTIFLFFALACGISTPTATTETPTHTTLTQEAHSEAQATKRTTNTPSQNMAIVAVDFLRLRSGAGNEYPVLTILEKGQELVIIERGEWYRVSADDKIGFVYSRYIIVEEK